MEGQAVCVMLQSGQCQNLLTLFKDTDAQVTPKPILLGGFGTGRWHL